MDSLAPGNVFSFRSVKPEFWSHYKKYTHSLIFEGVPRSRNRFLGFFEEATGMAENPM